MAEDENFEIISSRNLGQMQREVEGLKEQLNSPGFKITQKFGQSIQTLTDSISELNSIFKTAAEQMKVEEQGGKIEEKLDPIVNRLNEVIEQNRELAKAVLVVVDMLEEFMKRQREESMEQQRMNAPSIGIQRSMPMGGMNSPSMQRSMSQSSMEMNMPPFEMPKSDMMGPLPPPPAPEKKKKSFLGITIK